MQLGVGAAHCWKADGKVERGGRGVQVYGVAAGKGKGKGVSEGRRVRGEEGAG